MKYKGNSIEGRNREVVTFQKNGQPISFTVAALDIGFLERLRNLGVFEIPEPPLKVARDAKGGYIRNQLTNQLEQIPDLDNPGFKKKTEAATNRFQALRLYGHLREDENVQFEAVEPETDNSEEWVKFADGLHKEIVKSGLTDKEMMVLLEKGSDLESVVISGDETVNFSSTPEPTTEVPGAS